jgi:hypothetical protein
MKMLFRSLSVLATVFLLSNCINVEMETTVNKDRSGKGKLVYSWNPEQNVDHIDIDETFSTIESNPTVLVTGNREYDSEGTHYKEIEWTFTDINEVDLEGLTYSYIKEDEMLVMRAMFEDVAEEAPAAPANIGTPENFVEAPVSAAAGQSPDPGTALSPMSEAGSTGEITSSQTSPAPAVTSSGSQGLSAQEQMEMDAETQRQMEEMMEVMIRAALDGFSVKFRFTLPYKVLEASGAEIDGMTATWEIPLNDLVDPSRVGAFDEFKMVMKPE